MAVQKRVLLVEGVNDAQIILNLFGANNVRAEFRGYKTPRFDSNKNIEIREKGGIENLLEGLSIETKANNDGYLGIVVDADTSLDSRWQSLVDRLRGDEIGYENVPMAPVENGLVLESQGFLPRIGIWVMPNNQLMGKIENFIRLLVSADKESLWQISEKAVNEIPDNERLFANKDLIKAQVHTFLAWQDEPGRPMGESITRRYFQTDAPDALNFVSWIRKLYFS